ncbi:hypothetical protein B0H11DRAFT_1999031 [Mycena galericulata]|nr:hypothetical protein B0H11DRAFT_1999031 [Mycena galericulata]
MTLPSQLVDLFATGLGLAQALDQPSMTFHVKATNSKYGTTTDREEFIERPLPCHQVLPRSGRVDVSQFFPRRWQVWVF